MSFISALETVQNSNDIVGLEENVLNEAALLDVQVANINELLKALLHVSGCNEMEKPLLTSVMLASSLGACLAKVRLLCDDMLAIMK